MANGPSDSAELSPSAALGRLIRSFWVTPALYVAARLKIADLLQDGPLDSQDLAERTGTHARSLRRLLRALTSVGVFAEDGTGRFRQTALSACLVSGAPGSLRPAALVFGSPEIWQGTYGELSYSIETGRPAFERRQGMGYFDYLVQNVEQAAAFHEFMASGTSTPHAAIATAYDFSGVGTVVDVGGGQGALLVEILQRNPALQGIVFDRREVVAGAPALLANAGVAERCRIVSGDFFAVVPAGGDVYTLSQIVHDWDDERAAVILARCRQAAPAGAKILLIEQVMPADGVPPNLAFEDLCMLVWTGGIQRTEAEYAALLAGAGFRFTRTIPTASTYSIVEAVAV